jgi:hypothetical protein
MALISLTYLALPRRYQLRPEWQDAAVSVMIASVLVVVASRSVLWRKVAFWLSLGISSAIHLVVVHGWTERVPNLSRGEGKLATCSALCCSLPFMDLSGVSCRGGGYRETLDSFTSSYWHGKNGNTGTTFRSQVLAHEHSLARRVSGGM